MKIAYKRLLALLLILALVLPVLPAALAVETESGTNTPSTEEDSGSDEGGEGDTNPTPPPVPVTGVTLDPRDERSLDVGATQAYTASVSPDDATDRQVTWTSSSPGVATVTGGGEHNKTGTVRGVSPGQTTITATAGGKSAEPCIVNVSGLVLSSTSTELIKGNQTTLSVSPHGEARGLEYTWESSDRSVVRVEPGSGGSATLTALETGASTVTVRAGGKYPVSCTVTVKPNETTMSYRLDGHQPLSFSNLVSNLDAQCRSVTGASLRYVTSLQVSDANQGTLYYGYSSEADPGEGVASTRQYYYGSGPSGSYSLENVTFVPKPDFAGTTAVSYVGFTTSGQSYSGTIEFTVEATEGISFTSADGGPVKLTAEAFNRYSQSRNGRNISSVQFDLPASRYGTLYYNYSSENVFEKEVEGSDTFYRTRNPYLDNVTFVPRSGYTGTVRISFTAEDGSNRSFSGTLSITVSESASGGTTIRYSGSPGSRLYFRTSDFSDASYDATGYQLDRVTFSPPSSSRGVLYYDGDTKVTSGTSYYRAGSSRRIENISFIPDRDASGTISIPFTGWDTRDTRFTGTVKIDLDGGDASLSYKGTSGVRLYFKAADFSDACYDATGYQLSYVRFTLPASSRGVLYYDGDTKVSSGTSYYRNGSGSTRLLEDVSFIPDKDFTGTASISFTGYDTRGHSFSGTVTVRVTKDGKGALTYSGSAGVRLYFKTSDFSDASYDATGNQLDYVRFTLPASSRGILYYDGDTKVSSGTSYYRTGSGSTRLLEDVSFIPDKNFTGTASISFTGYDTRGRSFSGTVTVNVTAPKASAVNYYTSGPAVTFRTEEFSLACGPVLSGSLSRVRFTLPLTSAGRLYYNYAGPLQYDDYVSSSTDYGTGSSPFLYNVSFVPKAGFSGTVSIPFTAWDAKGTSCSGTVYVAVTPPTSSSYFSDMGKYAWAVPAADFLHRYGVVSGKTETTFAPSLNLRRGDFALMLSRAFRFPAASGGFTDVPADSYYAPAIAAAKAAGVVTGYEGGTFRPNATLTRQEAAVMIHRALRSAGLSPGDGSASSLSGFTDRSSVASYAAGPLAALVELGVLAGDSAGRLNPRASLTRAEMAVILHRALTL